MNTTPKEILFEEDARAQLKKGIEELAHVVAVTLGPRGRNVGLETAWGAPSISSDGCSIAKEIEFKDPFLNMGASMAKQVAEAIKEAAGDGTTTGILLLNALVQEGLKQITMGANPISLKRGLEKGLAALLEGIDLLATPIRTEQETRHAASVAAGGLADVGATIALCFSQVGPKGLISLKEDQGRDTSIERTEGMDIDRGYASSYFCTDVQRMVVELTRPAIVLIDKKLSSIQELLPLLQQVAMTGQELLLIAEEVEGDLLSTLIFNKIKGTLKVAVVKAPSFGDQRKALLEDLAILTGAELLTEDKGLSLKTASTSCFGTAERVVITKDKTSFIGGAGTKEALATRIGELERKEKDPSISSYDKERLQERRAKLQGGVAIIRIGAETESEMKRKKEAYQDSLNSTRAALESGIVPGGGVALLHAAKRLATLTLPPEEALGLQILARAAVAPFRQIALNTGHDPSLLLETVLTKGGSFGFNALTEKVEDLVEAGVIDPVKVVKTSLSNAVSMAGMVFLSEVLVLPQKELA